MGVKIPMDKGQFWGFMSICQCVVFQCAVGSKTYSISVRKVDKISVQTIHQWLGIHSEWIPVSMLLLKM